MCEAENSTLFKSSQNTIISQHCMDDFSITSKFDLHVQKQGSLSAGKKAYGFV